MSENTCPNVALSRNQNMWVVEESADKTLEFPAVTDIINVTADVFANQEIPTSDSKEKANTLNKLNVFNSSASPATANFGMYLRPTALDAAMQGDALMQALQGKLAAPFTGTLADALTDSDAQLVVTVTSGHVPLRGVIEVTSTPSGKELIRYRKAVKDAASPGKWLLSELTRGYKGTTAASGASGAAVSLKSRAFVQALCRPNVSAWIVIDKTLQAVQGCHVTDASISVTKEGAVELTGTLTGCRAFNAGPSSVAAEAQTSATSITVEDAKMFFRGAENPEHHQVGRQFRQGLRRDRGGRTDEHADRRTRHLRRMGRGRRGDVVDALWAPPSARRWRIPIPLSASTGQPGKCAPAPSSSPHPRSLPTSLATASPASPSTP